MLVSPAFVFTLLDRAESLNCTNSSSESDEASTTDTTNNDGRSLHSLLLVDRKGDRKLKYKQSTQISNKPETFKIPESDVMSRMKAFLPFMSEPRAPVTSDGDSAVTFVPMNDHASDSDSDSGSDSSESDEEDPRPHVEMRLALVAEDTSDSDNEADIDTSLIGEVTEENLKLPSDKCEPTASPVIEELN